MIRGCVDTITTKGVSGWIYSDGHKEPLSVEAVINGEVIGRSIANLLRPDLAAAGFGEGKCGFDIKFKNEIDLLFLPFLQVMLAATDLELRRSASTGFHDYFRALYQRYPRAGRSASVYGGLWTDRTDASALLKGRTDIGVVAPNVANCIARFILEGAVVIINDKEEATPHCGKPVSGKPIKADFTAKVAKAVFGADILMIMRAVLDDHPVAVRADVMDADEEDFFQMSTIENLPSPAECLGLIFPAGDQATAVDIVQKGHEFPEFLSDGSSRWSHTGALRKMNASLSPNLPIDRHQVRPGSVMLLGPGALCRIRAAAGSAVRVLLLPSRLSLLRFSQKAPSGELTHESGARIWI